MSISIHGDLGRAIDATSKVNISIRGDLGKATDATSKVNINIHGDLGKTTDATRSTALANQKDDRLAPYGMTDAYNFKSECHF